MIAWAVFQPGYECGRIILFTQENVTILNMEGGVYFAIGYHRPLFTNNSILGHGTNGLVDAMWVTFKKHNHVLSSPQLMF